MMGGRPARVIRTSVAPAAGACAGRSAAQPVPVAARRLAGAPADFSRGTVRSAKAIT